MIGSRRVLVSSSTGVLGILGAVGAAIAAGSLGEVQELPHSLQIWDNQARLAIPTGLKIWLALLAVTFLTSLAFVRKHAAARWAAGGFVSSHLLLAVVELGELATLRIGLVSIAHVVCWTPALVALLREIPRTQMRSGYGIWCRMLVGIIAIAFVFDGRDAVQYIYYHLAGHPELLATWTLPVIVQRLRDENPERRIAAGFQGDDR